MLMDHIKDNDLNNQVVTDERGEVTDNILIRKIYWTLLMPVIK